MQRTLADCSRCSFGGSVPPQHDIGGAAHLGKAQRRGRASGVLSGINRRTCGFVDTVVDHAMAIAVFDRTSVRPPRHRHGCPHPSPSDASVAHMPQDVTDVDREARAAKKAAAKRAAASGWYRNLHGTMSFAGLAGLNVAVEGQRENGDADAPGAPGSGEAMLTVRVRQEPLWHRKVVAAHRFSYFHRIRC